MADCLDELGTYGSTVGCLLGVGGLSLGIRKVHNGLFGGHVKSICPAWVDELLAPSHGRLSAARHSLGTLTIWGKMPPQ
jgi:hypothetical protein